jgi:bifunctional N-acetylglucosamine-1-phosphate-uridyltransferase/glucosamine-1-phosphate-acetyltransferase GlmU-like protein
MDSSVGTVVIPAMGLSQRFKDHGFMMHKALLKIDGVPIIKRIVDTVPHDWDIRVVIPIELAERFWSILGDRAELITLHGPTEGQSQTILRGVLGLNAAKPVMVTNCDLEVNADTVQFFSQWEWSQIMVHSHREGPEIYSYVATDQHGLVVDVAEKKRIGPWAQTGWWKFTKAADIHKALAKQIHRDLRHTNGEFYLSGALKLYEPTMHIFTLPHRELIKDYGTPEAIKAQGLEIVE